jgi:hypothetical protein
MEEHLELALNLAKASLAREESDESREEWFAEALRRELLRRMADDEVHGYEVAGGFKLSWRGIARYLRKRPI